MNQNDLIHKWAHGLNDATSGGAVYAKNGILYSYGHHFPIGVRCGEIEGKPAFVLNSRSYSPSTSKHQNWVSGATFHGERLFVPMSSDTPLDHSHQRALAEYCEKEVAEGERLTLSRGPRKQEEGLQRIHTAIDIAKRLHLFVKGNGKELNKDVKKRLAKVAKWSDARLDGLAERLAQEQVKAAAKAKRLEAKRRKEQRQELAKWKAGEPTRTYFKETALRIVGDEVETTHGATVPVAAARLLWNNWGSPKMVGKHVGPFVVNEAREDAYVIGCHTIEKEAAADLATRAGW